MIRILVYNRRPGPRGQYLETSFEVLYMSENDHGSFTTIYFGVINDKSTNMESTNNEDWMYIDQAVSILTV